MSRVVWYRIIVCGEKRAMKKNSLTPVLFFVFTLVSTHLHAQETVRFSVPLPLTGSYAKFAEIEKRSYEIARDEINALGGMKGKRVVLDLEDSRGDPEQSTLIVEKLLEARKQPVLFGEYSSSCSKAIAEVAEARRVPYLVVTGAADSITQQNGKYIFRMSPANAFYPSGLTSFFQEVVKPRTMAVIYESSDFGSSGAEVILKQAGRAGISILIKEKYEKGMTDFGSILSRVKRERPDIIYMVSYVMDAAHLMRQIKKQEIDAKLLAGGAAGFAIPEFIFLARDAAEYVTTATLWVPEAAYPGAKPYVEKYRAGYGENPSYHGAEAYSALYVIKDVLERAKTWTPDDIRDAMKQTDMMTAFGPIKFEDRDGYTNQNFMDTLVMQIIKGRHETIWPEKVATRKYIYPIPRWKDRK